MQLTVPKVELKLMEVNAPGSGGLDSVHPIH